MAGHVQKKGNNWYCVIEQGIDQGKRLPPKWVSVRKELGLSKPATKTQARELLVKLLAQKQTGRAIITKEINFIDFCNVWLEKYKTMKELSENTITQYEYGIKQLEGLNKSLSQIKPVEIQTLLTKKRNELSQSTVHAIGKTLGLAFKYAYKWQYINANPMDDVVKPPLPKPKVEYWEQEDVAKFLEEVSTHQYYSLFKLALGTGMRKSEILQLKSEQVDYKNHTVTIIDAKTDSGWRTIDISPEITKDLPRREGYLFLTATGRPIYKSKDLVNKIMRRAIKRAGVKYITFHGLRHTFATLMLTKGVNPKELAETLGHSDPAMLWRTYAHAIPKRQKKAARKLDNIFQSVGKKTERTEKEKAP